MLDKLTKADFDSHLNTVFQVPTDEFGTVDLELIEVEEKDFNVHESLSLIFRGDKEKILPQMIRRLNHEKMESLNVFMVPIMYGEGGEDGMYYQVVINRMKEKTG